MSGRQRYISTVWWSVDSRDRMPLMNQRIYNKEGKLFGLVQAYGRITISLLTNIVS